MELAVERSLCDIRAFDDLETETFESGGDIFGIVGGVGKARLARIFAIADDESDAMLR